MINKELIRAVNTNHIQKVKELLPIISAELLNHGFESNQPFNINGVEVGKMAAIHVAAYKGHIEILKLLIEDPRTNIDIKTSILKYSALQMAVANSQLESCELLLPVCNVLDKESHIPYFTANSEMQFTKDEEKRIKAKAIKDLLRIPTFIRACEIADLYTIKRMIEKEGVNANAEYNDNWGLKAACLNWHMDVVDYLLSLPQLDLNVRANGGLTILHCLSLSHDVNKIALPPLHDCSFSNPSLRYLMIEKLIKRGADPNARDSAGFTPLRFANASNFLDAVKALVANAADLTLRYKTDVTGMEIEEFNKTKERTELLIKKNADLQAKFQPLMNAQGNLKHPSYEWHKHQGIIEFDVFDLSKDRRPEVFEYLMDTKRRRDEFKAARESLSILLREKTNANRQEQYENSLHYVPSASKTI